MLWRKGPPGPYFAPRGNGKCPEGASPHLAKCCAERDACATIWASQKKPARKLLMSATCECEEVDDFDEHEQCLKDGKIGSTGPGAAAVLGIVKSRRRLVV